MGKLGHIVACAASSVNSIDSKELSVIRASTDKVSLFGSNKHDNHPFFAECILRVK